VKVNVNEGDTLEVWDNVIFSKGTLEEETNIVSEIISRRPSITENSFTFTVKLKKPLKFDHDATTPIFLVPGSIADEAFDYAAAGIDWNFEGVYLLDGGPLYPLAEEEAGHAHGGLAHVGSCPRGWSCSGLAQIKNADWKAPKIGSANISGITDHISGYEGKQFFVIADDLGFGQAETKPFELPANTIYMTWFQMGGAVSPSGVYIKEDASTSNNKCAMKDCIVCKPTATKRRRMRTGIKHAGDFEEHECDYEAYLEKRKNNNDFRNAKVYLEVLNADDGAPTEAIKIDSPGDEIGSDIEGLSNDSPGDEIGSEIEGLSNDSPGDEIGGESGGLSSDSPGDEIFRRLSIDSPGGEIGGESGGLSNDSPGDEIGSEIGGFSTDSPGGEIGGESGGLSSDSPGWVVMTVPTKPAALVVDDFKFVSAEGMQTHNNLYKWKSTQSYPSAWPLTRVVPGRFKCTITIALDQNEMPNFFMMINSDKKDIDLTAGLTDDEAKVLTDKPIITLTVERDDVGDLRYLVDGELLPEESLNMEGLVSAIGFEGGTSTQVMAMYLRTYNN